MLPLQLHASLGLGMPGAAHWPALWAQGADRTVLHAAAWVGTPRNPNESGFSG